MAYRLYTRNVAKGITDFNDQCVHILDCKTVGDDNVALLFDSEWEIFSVGHHTQLKDEMNALIYTTEEETEDFQQALKVYKDVFEYPISEKLDYMDSDEDEEEDYTVDEDDLTEFDEEELDCMDLEDQFEYLMNADEDETITNITNQFFQK